jgi:hypothetical protein
VSPRAPAAEVTEASSHNQPIARIVGIPAQAQDGPRGLIAAGDLSCGASRAAFVSPEGA